MAWKLLLHAAAMVGGVICTLFITMIFVSLPTTFPPSRIPDSSSLRVATANVAFDNTDPDATARVLERLDADLLIVLEWTGESAGPSLLRDERWRPVIELALPNPHGVLVLARKAIEVDSALVPSPVGGPCAMPIATVRLRFGAEELSVLGLHVPPPLRGCGEVNGPTIQYLAERVRDGRLTESLGALRRGDPVVIAGDFNALPGSKAMAVLRRSGLADAHAERHLRPVGTWTSGWMPVMARIDYVMTSEALAVAGSWTVHLPGSDHRAVIADLLPGSSSRP